MKKLHSIFLFLSLSLLLSCGNPSSIAFEELDLVDMNGQAVSMEDYKGKIIFLSIWATWCGDCRKEMPTVQNAKKQLTGDNTVYLFISDEPLSKIQGFIKKQPYDFTFLKMNQGLREIGITYIPQIYIINEAGEIVYQYTEGKAWDTEESLEQLRSFGM